MSTIIEPKVLKGFRDSLPENEIGRKKIIRKLEDCFKSFGFDPIDTPVLEYSEVLLGKGGGETDKQIYRFKDNGDRDVAMRFDLTVPFSRFIAAHSNEVTIPFKRYHIDKVWRGENTQKGRYREFIQCDFDIVGDDSAESDFEILSMMNRAFKILGIDNITFNISNRAIFNTFLEIENIRDKSVHILRTVDKLAKIGKDEVVKILLEEINLEQANKILDFITPEKNFLDTLSKLEKLCGSENSGITRLKQIYQYLKASNIEEKFKLNPAITRGLDYYTGIVYETFLNDLPTIGSVCSGGRYDNLASLYTKEEFPGVGSSIGLDRLLAALKELNLLEEEKSETDVIIFYIEKEYTVEYLKLAEKIRDNNLNCEFYLSNKKINKQFTYAENKKIPFALICGKTEFEGNFFTLKDLKKRENYSNLSFEDVIKIIKDVKE